MTRGRAIAAGAAAVALVLVVALLLPGAHVQRVPRVRRLLIVSLPMLSWNDVTMRTMPAVDRFARHAAVADLATRVGVARTSLADAYVTLGAGTRARSGGDVTALDAHDAFGTSTAAAVYTRRTGWMPHGAILTLSIPTILDEGAHSRYRARPGELGAALARRGVARAVIAANGAAATALMGRDGTVPEGSIGSRRAAGVLQAFDAAWRAPGPRVVLVEASPGAGGDALFAQLLRRVDPTNDAVMLVAPVAGTREPQLSAFALQAPGLPASLLRSPSTRRSGFVQLGDVAPTVLDLFRISTPAAMEGRPAAAAAHGNGGTDRLDFVRNRARDAQVRDRANPYATITLWVVASVVLFFFVFRRFWPGWTQRVVAFAAIVLLAYIPATYFSALVPRLSGSLLLLAIAAPLVVFAIAFGAVYRRGALDVLLAGLGVMVALVALDILLGAPLQLNTLYGYSAAVAGRFAGIGNLTFAFFAASALLFAVLLTERVEGRRGMQLATALLVAAVLIEGLPMLGADAGGVFAMVPAFGCTLLVLSRRRVRALDVVLLFAAALAAVLVMGAVDIARPSADQTHLARLIERVHDGGMSYLTSTISRRWSASLGTSRVALLVVALLFLALGAEFFALQRGRLPRGVFASPSARAAIGGLVLLGLLGLVANDSGAAVPAMMYVVAVPVVVLHYDEWRRQSREVQP